MALVKPLRNQKIAVGVVFVSAMFINIMDITIVNVALPTIGEKLHATPESLSAVSIGFLVALAVTIPASGWLGDRFGLKRVLLTAIAVFTIASALCGAAGSFSQLVLFRVLQGAAGGSLTPVGMALLFRTYPPEERVRASGILTIPTAFAPALGPVLGGLIVDRWDWRWAFYVNVPIGIAALIFGLVFLKEPERHPAGAFDLPGLLLAGIGFATFMYGISEGPSRGWSDPGILASIAVGVVLLISMVRHQLRRTEPLLKLRLLQEQMFRVSAVVIFFAPAAFLGGLFAIALFFQSGLGLSPLAAGLNTFPEAAGVMVGAQVASRIVYPRFGAKPLMLFGTSMLGVMMLLLAQIDSKDDLWWGRIVMFGLGYCISHNFTATQANAFARITPADMSRASTIFNMVRQLGAASGVALLATVISAIGAFEVVDGRPVPDLSAYHWAFVAAAGLAWMATLSATQLQHIPPPRKAAAEATPAAVELAPIAD